MFTLKDPDAFMRQTTHASSAPFTMWTIYGHCEVNETIRY